VQPDRIIVSVHNQASYEYVKTLIPEENIVFIKSVPSTNYYKYNLYINYLIEQVTEGFIYCVDDDDELAHPKVIETLKLECTNENKLYIYKIKIGNKILPNKKELKLGNIGTPNFVVHSSHAKKCKWKDINDADGIYIKELNSILDIEWKDEIIYIAKKSNGGHNETEVHWQLFILIVLILLSIFVLKNYF
jgi:hypothetical protein